MSGHVCGACNTPLTTTDALCQPCWKLVPANERAVYMTIWRQVQARLLADTALTAVTNLLQGFVKQKLSDVQHPPVAAHIPKHHYEDLIIAKCPTTSFEATTASELARLTGLPIYAVTNWLTAQRDVHPRLKYKDINAGINQRPRYVYWVPMPTVHKSAM